MHECVLSLSRWCLDCFFIWDPNRQRTLPGKSPFSILEPFDVIHNFSAECQYFFLLSFRNETHDARPNDRPSSWASGGCDFGHCPRFAVCVEKSVPVASGEWHAQVWVKVLAP